jgi:hypothetical protein
MSFAVGVVFQVGQPPAVAVPLVAPPQRVIEAEVISSSIKTVSAIENVRQQNLTFESRNRPSSPQVFAYTSRGEKRMDSARLQEIF